MALILLYIDILVLDLLNRHHWIIIPSSPWLCSLDPYYFITSFNHQLECFTTVFIFLEFLKWSCRVSSKSPWILVRCCKKSLFHYFFVHNFRDNLRIFEGNIVALRRLLLNHIPWRANVQGCMSAWSCPIFMGAYTELLRLSHSWASLVFGSLHNRWL